MGDQYFHLIKYDYIIEYHNLKLIKIINKKLIYYQIISKMVKKYKKNTKIVFFFHNFLDFELPNMSFNTGNSNSHHGCDDSANGRKKTSNGGNGDGDESLTLLVEDPILAEQVRLRLIQAEEEKLAEERIEKFEREREGILQRIKKEKDEIDRIVEEIDKLETRINGILISNMPEDIKKQNLVFLRDIVESTKNILNSKIESSKGNNWVRNHLLESQLVLIRNNKIKMPNEIDNYNSYLIRIEREEKDRVWRVWREEQRVSREENRKFEIKMQGYMQRALEQRERDQMEREQRELEQRALEEKKKKNQEQYLYY